MTGDFPIVMKARNVIQNSTIRTKKVDNVQIDEKLQINMLCTKTYAIIGSTDNVNIE